MLSRTSATLLRQVVPAASRKAVGMTSAKPSSAAARATSSPRTFTTIKESITANDAFKMSCYAEIDYTIPDEATVYDAVQRFAAFNIGCLVTLDGEGKISGMISERDYVCKIALLGKTSRDTKVKEISTHAPNLITATPDDSVDDCMAKMLTKDIRHLPLLDNADGKVVGMISIKDLVKTIVEEKEKTIKVLSDFALGKGGHFGSE